jgi:hypothetical protein
MNQATQSPSRISTSTGPCAVPSAQGEIPSALTELSSQLQSLWASLSELEERLHNVVRQEPCTPCDPQKSLQPPPANQVFERLNELSAQVQVARNGVNSILSRLQT